MEQLEGRAEKTADFFRSHHDWFSREITSEKRAQNWNSILMTRHYPDLSSGSDRLVEANYSRDASNQKHYTQYGISPLSPPKSFCRETSSGVSKCPLFPQARQVRDWERSGLNINIYYQSLIYWKIIGTKSDRQQSDSNLFWVCNDCLFKFNKKIPCEKRLLFQGTYVWKVTSAVNCPFLS